MQALNPDTPKLTQVIQELGVVMSNSVADTILHAQGCNSATPALDSHSSKLLKLFYLEQTKK
jgi:hypothetical protein